MRSLVSRILLVAVTAFIASAEVRLPHLLSSHMVLQRDRPIHVWGWSEPGEEITVSLNAATQRTTGDQLGRWSVYLPPHGAGGPFQVKVSGSRNSIAIDDVLIGDVWFASGQSNMEMPLNGFPGNAVVDNAAEEIRNANHPKMRFLLAPRTAVDFPQRDYDASWTVCTPETAENFSAVAYFFGRHIAEEEHVPVGLIDATWGGTPAEAWISLHGLSADPGLMPVFAARAEMVDVQADMSAQIRAEKRADATAKGANQNPPKHEWHPDPASWAPAWLYNGMIAPAVDFAIKGVIWYEGESNSGSLRAPIYERVFPALISDWRLHWREGNFPFLFVQISSFQSDATEFWPVIREAQRRTLSVANTAMAVTIDIGNPDNVHPADKQDVGARLALAARALSYGENVEYAGPLFRETSVEKDCVRVWFDHASGGLVAKGGTLQGFEIAGDDHHFAPANARIDGSSVLVSGGEVKAPKYVRYGWANAPVVNLFNGAGLPASPFTSEEKISPP
jgi:sialate O-acetylesterase